jgi:hypothetical protein
MIRWLAVALVLAAGCAGPIDLAQLARERQVDTLCYVRCAAVSGGAPCGRGCLDEQLRRLRGG